MPAVTALIQFGQGLLGTAGEAYEGDLVSGTVNVQNDDNTNIASWRFTLLDVPPDSALATGVLASADDNTPTTSFVPDVFGSYRVMLEVFDTAGLVGTTDKDIRNFGVRNARGIIIPSYQKLPDPLPVQGSGLPGQKPDEQNYAGQTRGWTGDRTDGQMEEFFLTYDDLKIKTVSSTPFTAAASGEEPLYRVTVAGASVFNLPSGARVGQQFRVMPAGGAATITVNPPGGHSIEGASSMDLLTGASATFVYLGGTSWTLLGLKQLVNDLVIAAGIFSTDQTGFQTIGAIQIDSASFPNTEGVTWRAIIETTNATDSAEIRLFNVTTSSVVASSTFSTTSLTPVQVGGSISLTSGVNLYEAQLRLTGTGSPDQATCKNARLTVNWFQP